MDRFGYQLLPGAAFTLDQHGGAAGSDLSDQVKNLEHGIRFADDMLKVIALFQRALELLVFFFHPAAGHGRAYVGQQLFIVPWLLDKIGGALLHGAYGVIQCAVGGNHNHGKLGIARANVSQDFQPVAVRQGKVEQNKIKGMFAQAGRLGGAAHLHPQEVARRQQLDALEAGDRSRQGEEGEHMVDAAQVGTGVH